MLLSALAVPGAGAATMAQVRPFQCTTAFPWPCPTAQQFADEMQRTPRSPAPGVGTSDHACPFQCSAWPPTESSPTAQQSPGETQVTDRSWLNPSPVCGLGAGTTDQVCPFQCSARFGAVKLL